MCNGRACCDFRRDACAPNARNGINAAGVSPMQTLRSTLAGREQGGAAYPKAESDDPHVRVGASRRRVLRNDVPLIIHACPTPVRDAASPGRRHGGAPQLRRGARSPAERHGARVYATCCINLLKINSSSTDSACIRHYVSCHTENTLATQPAPFSTYLPCVIRFRCRFGLA